MDQERFRKELEARTVAHEGDVLAAVSEMLGEVIESVESLPDGLREIVESGELLGVRPKEGGEEPTDEDPQRQAKRQGRPDTA